MNLNLVTFKRAVAWASADDCGSSMTQCPMERIKTTITGTELDSGVQPLLTTNTELHGSIVMLLITLDFEFSFIKLKHQCTNAGFTSFIYLFLKKNKAQNSRGKESSSECVEWRLSGYYLVKGQQELSLGAISCAH
jgi:hypothetical protein